MKGLYLDYTYCKLYGIKSKRNLRYLLKIKSNVFFAQDNVAFLVYPCINYSSSADGRLMEKPKFELKRVQKLIKDYLNVIDIPDYVYYGVKDKSAVENAKIHSGTEKYVLKIDIKSFFPSITRDVVYKFFREQMNTSSDVAEALTNLTTYNLDAYDYENKENIQRWLAEKGIKTHNHLMTGSPCSPILSFLANSKMYEKMYRLAEKNSVLMSVYADDITFSSNHRLSHAFLNQEKEILANCGYSISRNKTRFYDKKHPKLITGTVVGANGKLLVRNKISHAIFSKYEEYKENPLNESLQKQLIGLIAVAKQVDSNAFTGISNSVRGKNENRH